MKTLIPSLVLAVALAPSVSPAQWDQLGPDIDGEFHGNQSGYSVAISSDGSLVAIGAPRNNNAAHRSGHVRVFRYDAGKNAWLQVGPDIDGKVEWEESGYSVALSSDGSRVAIGAYFNDPDGHGHVRVYQYNSWKDAWLQVGPDVDSGSAVALSSDGSRVAIGAHLYDWLVEAGRVQVYEWISPNWVQVGPAIQGEAALDRSGFSVALSSDGSRVAIGAPSNDGAGSRSGHVRVYQHNKWTNTWLQVGPDIDGEAADDLSGYSVALSSDGSRVAIGAPFNNGHGGSSGQVRVYEWVGAAGDWVQLGDDIDGEAAGDNSGGSVALSSDGSRVAIGAVGNDGNGPNSGHVRVFSWLSWTSTWIHIDPDIDGEAAEDHCGSSVALSSDGSLVAVGAEWNDGNGDLSGHVRVYSSDRIFVDGFESGNTWAWSATVP